MSIANLENVVSNAERRALANNESHDRPPGRRPGLRRGQLARQARTDDDRGGRPRGQGDPADHRRGGQEHLRPPLRRPRSSGRSSISSRRARPSRPATCCRRRRSWSGSSKAPGLRKRAEEVAAKFSPDLTDADAATAAAASAAEFILEGLHVHNKLNKSAKGARRRTGGDGDEYENRLSQASLLPREKVAEGRMRVLGFRVRSRHNPNP